MKYLFLLLLVGCGYAERNCITGKKNEKYYARSLSKGYQYFDFDFETLEKANSRCEKFLETGE